MQISETAVPCTSPNQFLATKKNLKGEKYDVTTPSKN